MFVNSVPFLVSASRNINLITIKHAPYCTASKIAYLLERIVRVYNRAGFTVQTILMDYEFEKVHDHVPNIYLNLPAAGEHVGEIERRIRVIKERCRGIICTLPYPSLSQLMLVHLLHFVVMWLNNFPSNGGVSSHWSLCEIVLCHHLDYTHHCCTPFGAYCEVHEDHDTGRNSMRPCGIPSICLGSTGNIQGTYNFYSLVSGLILKQCTWTELPVPQSVIAWVTTLSRQSGVSSDLVFANRKRVPFDWPDNPPDSLDDTPVGAYPHIPAEVPGVLVDRNPPGVSPISPINEDVAIHTNNHDWTALADAAMENADLDAATHLPQPPKVIEIDNDDDNANSPPLPTAL
jgi:hypothetical protein